MKERSNEVSRKAKKRRGGGKKTGRTGGTLPLLQKKTKGRKVFRGRGVSDYRIQKVPRGEIPKLKGNCQARNGERGAKSVKKGPQQQSRGEL